MIQQREDLPLLIEADNGNKNIERGKNHKCCCPLQIYDSCQSDIPLEIVIDHIVPFLDRKTYNACLLLCHKVHQILTASWWKTPKLSEHSNLPPWPSKLVSKDQSCRVSCLTFSHDNLLLTFGCSDGKIRSWDVRTGELPMPEEGHWPDEAVVALTYSNRSDRRLLASASTDGTIRIWKIHNSKPFSRAVLSESLQTNKTNDSASSITPVSKNQQTLSIHNYDDDIATNGLTGTFALSCALCIPADYVVSLHFSPGDSYLVSGHLRMRNAEDLHPTSTIEIREVRTGVRLRHLEGAGVPVGFVPLSPSLHRRHPQTDQPQQYNFHESSQESEEHRLLSICGPNTCLKLWSWNESRSTTSVEDYDDKTENHNHNISNFLYSQQHPIDQNAEQIATFPALSNHIINNNILERENYKTHIDDCRCIQQWFLDRFNTVLPVPAAARANCLHRKSSNNVKHNNNNSDDGNCEILVAVINEPKDSFTVWNTRSTQDRKVFRNTSPYEIRFSPDGTKIASVDDFNTVKVWRVSDGVLLKTFSGDDECETIRSMIPSTPNHSCISNLCFEDEDSDETSVSYVCDDFCDNEDGESRLFPIHELVFSKDSSTVAVISRCYNEVHLFTT